jgi:TfoX/Sxy family transcriptional regulator of competence genes
MEVLVSRVRSVLDGRPVTARRMFGGLTFLLNGNMLCCVSEKGLMARVGAKAEPVALERPYAAPCLGAGRRMAGFILVEREGLTTDADLAAWLDMALAYVAELPAKSPKPAGRSRSNGKPKAAKR